MELKQLAQKSADELKAHLVELHKEQLRPAHAEGHRPAAPRPMKPAVFAARSLA